MAGVRLIECDNVGRSPSLNTRVLREPVTIDVKEHVILRHTFHQEHLQSK